MSNNEMMQIIDGIRKFPIGEIAANRETLLCKAKVVSYLAPQQEQFSTMDETNQIEEKVRAFLGNIISLKKGEEIPSIAKAEQFLRLSNGFLQDYAKVQYIKERHPEFTQIYELISDQMKKQNQIGEAKQF